MAQEVLQRRREPWRQGSQWPATRSWQQTTESNPRSWCSCSYRRSCQRTQCQPFYSHLTFGTNWKEKKLDKWVPHEMTENQKVVILKCPHLLFYPTTVKLLSTGLWHAMKSGFYMTTSIDLVEAPKHFPKKLTPKTGHGHCLVWSTIPFWFPVKPLHLRSVLSQSMRCIKNWRPAAGTGQQNGPNSSPWQCPTTCHTTNASKVEWIGLQSFASSAIFTWPLANRLPFPQASQQLFAGKCFHNQQ